MTQGQKNLTYSAFLLPLLLPLTSGLQWISVAFISPELISFQTVPREFSQGLHPSPTVSPWRSAGEQNQSFTCGPKSSLRPQQE